MMHKSRSCDSGSPGGELSSFELLAIEGHKDDYGLERVQLVVEQMLTTVAVKEDES